MNLSNILLPPSFLQLKLRVIKARVLIKDEPEILCDKERKEKEAAEKMEQNRPARERKRAIREKTCLDKKKQKKERGKKNKRGKTVQETYLTWIPVLNMMDRYQGKLARRSRPLPRGGFVKSHFLSTKMIFLLTEPHLLTTSSCLFCWLSGGVVCFECKFIRLQLNW